MKIKNVQDIYTLSPMQQGMLFHVLRNPELGLYLQQFSCSLHGDLNVPAFKRAWQQLIDRHPVLRTAFFWEELDEPRQVVRQRAGLPWACYDWQGLPDSEQQTRWCALLEAERKRGLKLNVAPLMRQSLVRVAPDVHRFAWLFHHLLLDGWSTSLVLKEMWDFYHAFDRGHDWQPEQPRPYRDYIAWLKAQDLTEAQAFWRQTLAGLSAPTPLLTGRRRQADETLARQYAIQETHLPESLMQALLAMGRQNRLTLNTLVQGAWALLLSRYSGEEDVAFGVVMSVRPADLAGAEAMAGLFINTLPARVRVAPDAPVLTWLQDLQAQQVKLRKYQHTPLAQVQAWSGLPRHRPLFESILVFENFPLDSLEQADARVRVRDVRIPSLANYPLHIVMTPASAILGAIYDCGRFEPAVINQVLVHLQRALEAFAAHPERTLDDISLDDAPGAALAASDDEPEQFNF